MLPPLVLELTFGAPLLVLNRGTSRPVSALMNEPERGPSLWVVKPPHPLRPGSLLAEGWGADVCRVLSVKTPESAIARLPETPVFNEDTEAGARTNELIRKNPGGLVYCSRMCGDGVEHTAGSFRNREPKDILRLFLADAFMWNFDRTVTKPNFLWDQHRLVAIDHGHAFSGIEAIEESGVAKHDLCDHRRSEWDEHVARAYLSKQFQKGKLSADDISEVAAPLRGRGDELWDLVGRWPSAMGPLGFQQDLERFVRSRIQVVGDLEHAIQEAFAKR